MEVALEEAQGDGIKTERYSATYIDCKGAIGGPKITVFASPPRG